MVDRRALTSDRSKLCAANRLWIVQVLVHTVFDVFTNKMMAYCAVVNDGGKTFFPQRRRLGARDPGRGDEALFVWSHSSDGSTLHLYYNALLIKTNMIFSGHDFGLFFLVQFRKIGFI